MIQKILVGTDTSASADLAVQTAAGLALAHDAELLILHVKREQVRDAFDPGEGCRRGDVPGGDAGSIPQGEGPGSPRTGRPGRQDLLGG